jgi:hypothetical protein
MKLEIETEEFVLWLFFFPMSRNPKYRKTEKPEPSASEEGEAKLIDLASFFSFYFEKTQKFLLSSKNENK